MTAESMVAKRLRERVAGLRLLLEEERRKEAEAVLIKSVPDGHWKERHALERRIAIIENVIEALDHFSDYP